MRLLQMNIRRIYFILYVTFSLSLALISQSSLPSVHALGCDASGGNGCTQWNDFLGYYHNTGYFSGPSNNSYYSRDIISYMFVGTGDGRRYMLFQEDVTQNPDPANSIYLWTDYADGSSGCNTCTIHTRVWSNNGRSQNAPYSQGDYESLDEHSNCESSTVTDSASVTVTTGIIGWTLNSSPYSSCTYQTPSDQYSNYFDYTMTASATNGTRINIGFVNAQAEVNNCCQNAFVMGYWSKVNWWFFGGQGVMLSTDEGQNHGDTYTY